MLSFLGMHGGTKLSRKLEDMQGPLNGGKIASSLFLESDVFSTHHQLFFKYRTWIFPKTRIFEVESYLKRIQKKKSDGPKNPKCQMQNIMVWFCRREKVVMRKRNLF